MEIDSAPVVSETRNTEEFRTHEEDGTRQPQAMDFDLNPDHIRKVLAFGKGLQQLYSVMGGDSDGKLKTMLQVSQITLSLNLRTREILLSGLCLTVRISKRIELKATLS